MDIRVYSTTAASNTADFPEGMAPSAVNDEARELQAELAQLLADGGGNITLGGTATAYTATLFTTPSALSGKIYFSAKANITNTGGATTLVVTPNGASAFASKKIKTRQFGSEVDLWAGAMVADSHYLLQYDSAADGTAGAFLLLNPSPPNGTLLQSTYGQYTTNATHASVIPLDDTIPQVTEGDQIISVVITPLSATSKIRLRFSGQYAIDAITSFTAAIFVNGGTNAIAATRSNPAAANSAEQLYLETEHTPGAITAQTYTVRVGPGSGNARMNGSTTSRIFGGVQATTLVIEEIKA